MAKNLLFDCSYSEVWVHPKNWKTLTTKKSLDLNWYVECKFYDPVFKDKYPKGFPFRKKLNRFRTLEERKAAIDLLLKEIPILFEEKGYNPITKKFMKPEVKKVSIEKLNPNLDIIKAFRLAHDKIIASQKHKDEIRYMLNRFEKAAIELRMNEIKIYDFKRSELKLILEYMQLPDAYFNTIRLYFFSLFVELIDEECCENNIARDIRKRKTIKKIREVLDLEILKQILEFLKYKYPDFYNYTMLFFYSGARTSELFRLKAKDVDLNNKEYTIIIEKGKRYTETIKVILPSALKYWKAALKNAKPNDYIFSKNLAPGEETVKPSRITRRWKSHVKDKLFVKNGKVYEKSKIMDSIENYEPITADFYSLKHLFLDLVDSTINSNNEASGLASHKTDITEKVYLVTKEKRKREKLKRMNIDILQKEA